MKKRRHIQPRKRGVGEKATVKQVPKDRRLVQSTIKLLVIVGVLIGGSFALMSFLQDEQKAKEKELSKLKNEVRKVQGKNNSLKRQIEDLGAAAQVYADLNDTRSNMEFTIDPLSIRPILAELKEAYYISTLNLEIEQQEDLQLKEVKLDGLETVHLSITMNVASLSDHFIYGFVDALKQRLPGIVHLTRMQLERDQPMTIELLSRLSRGENVETLSGIVELEWYGFIESGETADDAAAGGGA